MSFFNPNSFEYVEPADGAYGSFENGSWNGMIGMLVRAVIICLDLIFYICYVWTSSKLS